MQKLKSKINNQIIAKIIDINTTTTERQKCFNKLTNELIVKNKIEIPDKFNKEKFIRITSRNMLQTYSLFSIVPIVSQLQLSVFKNQYKYAVYAINIFLDYEIIKVFKVKLRNKKMERNLLYLKNNEDIAKIITKRATGYILLEAPWLSKKENNYE